MDWLIQNPIADMYGPHFLALYAGVIFTIIVLNRIWLGRRDQSDAMPLPAIPPNPDPYEIAYLRGGDSELIRVVVFSLIQKGYLRIDQSGKEPIIERTVYLPAQRALTPVELRVHSWFASPRKARELFGSSGLKPELRVFSETFAQRLKREHLLMPDEAKTATVRTWLFGAAVIAGLGGYKFLVALEKGKHNFIFLIILGTIGLAVLTILSRLPRLSKRGRAYLERVQFAFEKLKLHIPRKDSAVEAATTAAGAVDTTPLLVLGLFGVSALSNTAYDYYPQTFRHAAVTGGDGSAVVTGCGSSSGSSCGSGGCSGGGGCGGCGGGGCGGD